MWPNHNQKYTWKLPLFHTRNSTVLVLLLLPYICYYLIGTWEIFLIRRDVIIFYVVKFSAVLWEENNSNYFWYDHQSSSHGQIKSHNLSQWCDYYIPCQNTGQVLDWAAHLCPFHPLHKKRVLLIRNYVYTHTSLNNFL